MRQASLSQAQRVTALLFPIHVSVPIFSEYLFFIKKRMIQKWSMIKEKMRDIVTKGGWWLTCHLLLWCSCAVVFFFYKDYACFCLVSLLSLSQCPKAWFFNMSLHIRAACSAWKPIPASTNKDTHTHICMHTHTIKLRRRKQKENIKTFTAAYDKQGLLKGHHGTE